MLPSRDLIRLSSLRCDTPQWCVVYAMIIVFLLFLYINTISCQLATPNMIHNCSFLNKTYLLNSAVSQQIQFANQTSITLTANNAFLYASSLSSFELGLIYQFSSANFLVPFPVLFDCALIVQSCQLKTITGTTITTRDSESIRVQLTSFNFTTTTTASSQFNAMGLYLKQGRYQLSNCSLDNGQQMTDPQRIFHIQIQYEKSVGTSCDSTSDPCGSSLLTNCSSSICTCLQSSSSLVSYSSSSYCADTMNSSNCTIFPSRCITWCNQTRNYLCICPSDTLKIQRNNYFTCELPVNSNNCSINDNIRRCPLGQCCFNGRCMDCSMTTIATSKISNSNDSSLDESLRIALGVIAGLLGTSMIILLSAFCWIRQRHKHRRIVAEKSLTNSSSSSLYISPIQQQLKFPSSISIISQYPTFYRTDSFCQAVLSGTKPPHIIERVSTKRDSYIYEKHGWSSPTFSALEYVIPSPTNSMDIDKQNNIYQIIIPSTPVLTHVV